MYLLLPENFLVSTCYIDKNTLGIEVIINEEDILENKFREASFLSRQGLIGVSLPNEIAKRWVRDGKAMEEQADMLGVPIIVKNAENNEEIQIEDIEELINRGASVLIIVPINSRTIGPIIERAKSLGVKIIAYDRLIEYADIDAYVSFNSLRVGEIQGRYLIGKVPEGNYVIISGDPSDNNSKLLKYGAMEYIQPRVLQRYINIVKDAIAFKWDPDVAYNIVKEALKANNNKIDAILAPSDDIAGGVVRALEEQGLAGRVYVTGEDGNLEAAQRIVRGTQSMTVFKDTRELGKEAINIAVKLVRSEPLDASYMTNNGKIEVPSILLEPIFVDKDNLDKVLIDSGYLNKNEVYGRNNFIE